MGSQPRTLLLSLGVGWGGEDWFELARVLEPGPIDFQGRFSVPVGNNGVEL